MQLKDIKFTDLAGSQSSHRSRRSSVHSDAVVKTEAHYSELIEKARKKLIAALDAEIQNEPNSLRPPPAIRQEWPPSSSRKKTRS